MTDEDVSIEKLSYSKLTKEEIGTGITVTMQC